ncbi:MAG: hypothetical protein LBI29_04200 [Rickettsiales bacterium]|jgi:hypothetical protein|nr:hypothetical protein [Rickettsiales bacterium]
MLRKLIILGSLLLVVSSVNAATINVEDYLKKPSAISDAGEGTEEDVEDTDSESRSRVVPVYLTKEEAAEMFENSEKATKSGIFVELAGAR